MRKFLFLTILGSLIIVQNTWAVSLNRINSVVYSTASIVTTTYNFDDGNLTNWTIPPGNPQFITSTVRYNSSPNSLCTTPSQPNNSTARAYLMFSCIPRDNTLYYNYRGGSETNYDFFYVFRGSTEILKTSGNKDSAWTAATIANITTTTEANRIEFKYVKDESSKGYLDRWCVDDVRYACDVTTYSLAKVNGVSLTSISKINGL